MLAQIKKNEKKFRRFEKPECVAARHCNRLYFSLLFEFYLLNFTGLRKRVEARAVDIPRTAGSGESLHRVLSLWEARCSEIPQNKKVG